MYVDPAYNPVSMGSVIASDDGSVYISGQGQAPYYMPDSLTGMPPLDLGSPLLMISPNCDPQFHVVIGGGQGGYNAT